MLPLPFPHLSLSSPFLSLPLSSKTPTPIAARGSGRNAEAPPAGSGRARPPNAFVTLWALENAFSYNWHDIWRGHLTATRRGIFVILPLCDFNRYWLSKTKSFTIVRATLRVWHLSPVIQRRGSCLLVPCSLSLNMQRKCAEYYLSYQLWQYLTSSDLLRDLARPEGSCRLEQPWKWPIRV